MEAVHKEKGLIFFFFSKYQSEQQSYNGDGERDVAFHTFSPLTFRFVGFLTRIFTEQGKYRLLIMLRTLWKSAWASA